jgi:hypothetical protein
MKFFTGLTLVALWLIALVPLLRFIAGRDVTLTGGPVPLWLSLLVAVVAAGLLAGATEGRRYRRSQRPHDDRGGKRTLMGAIFRPQYALAKALGVPVTALLE